jgi:hypothetical protein
MLTNSYNFHGLHLTITANHPAVAAALHARLRQFATAPQPAPHFTFEFWCVPDHSQHVVQPPTTPTRPIYDLPDGQIVYSDMTEQLYLDYGDGIRAVCDGPGGHVRVSLVADELAYVWLVSHLIFTLPLLELLKRHGWYSLHAAGLSVGGNGLLISGASGAGKSTLTIALLRAGFDLLGDDMLFLRRQPHGLQALAFPDEVDVTTNTVKLFPEVVYGVQFVPTCTPTTLVFPRVAHTARSVLTPLDADAALLELVPNILLTQPAASQAHFDILAELVRTTRAYRLETGRDWDALPTLLRNVVV